MKRRKSALDEYKAKRNFDVTAEPSGRPSRRKNSGDCFVIHKHEARQLHYDLRLEVKGVLKSWAVPKGPSMDPAQRRLARQVEDHPVSYAKFEGVIPHGEYGGGTILVWDHGTYRNTTKRGERLVPMDEALEAGHVTFELAGQKLKGGFAMTRTGGDDDRAQWILVKIRDAEADARRNPLNTQPRSVLTQRTLHQVEQEEKTLPLPSPK